MGISKVIYGGRTLIDLTNDDIKADKLLKGIKAHDSNGEPVVGTCEYDVKSEGLTAIAAEILSGKTAAVGGEAVTGTMPNKGAVNGTIAEKEGKFTIPAGYHDGSGQIGLDETEKAKLIPENIREGRTILGVTGTMTGNEGENPQPKIEVNAPLTEDLKILPDTEYTCLSEVVVKKVPYLEIDNTADGKGITVQIG